MKINSMKEKSSIEISENDLLIIEDEEDTKKITVREFKEFIKEINNNSSKRLINKVIDGMVEKLNSLRYIVSKSVDIETYIYILNEKEIFIAFKNNSEWINSVQLEDIFNKIKCNLIIKNRLIETKEKKIINSLEYEYEEFNNLKLENKDLISINISELTNSEISELKEESISINIKEDDEFKYNLIEPSTFINKILKKEE